MKTYKYIYQLMAYRPFLYALNGLLWLLIHLLPLLPGIILQSFFDQLSGHSSTVISTTGLLALLAAIALSRIVIIYFGGLTDILHRFSISTIIRRNLFAHLLHKPSATTQAGEVIIHFREDAEQAESAVSWVLDVIGKFLFAIGAFVVLLNISVSMTLLVFIPLVVIVMIANKVSYKVEENRERSKEASTAVANTIGEFTSIAQSVNLANAEPYVIEKITALNEQRKQRMLKDRVLTQALDAIFSNTVSLGTGLILLLAASAIRNGTFTIGDLSLFIYYLAFITEFTDFFGMFLAHYRQTAVSFSRMEKLFQKGMEKELVEHHSLSELPAEQKREVEPLETLTLHNLSYVYPGTEKGFRNIELTIDRGSLTVITGVIGSGKSTLLKALAGVLPYEGEIRWNGRAVTDASAFFTPPASAYTPQIPTVFQQSLQENIQLGVYEEENTLDRSLHIAVLQDDVHRKGTQLSGGQKQRTAIARMFAREAELYLMDDIGSALDIETEQKMWERIAHEFLHKKTMIIASHSQECLRRADQIVVMKDGQIVDIIKQ
ncbi:ABC transporter ATP-binding protein [Fictibacillus macauensis ZFHKF-1]|uniref:ABC transporter ATP-binding protein n=1 Tax=Fictibacillus macauensis ZFHKF-1 TaxID=1196324 RepID=I8UK32_9BACL|nr:ABC transporter ATP-binding protein [Fictibacillus macauensis]EIT87245.1 ABC transporter ATP-binding protein [Fictibacillus macauensis ZFHKF-1]